MGLEEVTAPFFVKSCDAISTAIVTFHHVLHRVLPAHRMSSPIFPWGFDALLGLEEEMNSLSYTVMASDCSASSSR